MNFLEESEKFVNQNFGSQQGNGTCVYMVIPRTFSLVCLLWKSDGWTPLNGWNPHVMKMSLWWNRNIAPRDKDSTNICMEFNEVKYDHAVHLLEMCKIVWGHKGKLGSVALNARHSSSPLYSQEGYSTQSHTSANKNRGKHPHLLCKKRIRALFSVP